MSKIILIILFLTAFTAPLIYAIDNIQESGQITWKFCDSEKILNYKVINGTLHDTAHLRLQGNNNCETYPDSTDLQLQIFHTSNNQTSFTLTMPDDLSNQIIDVRLVGNGYLETFQFNSTVSSLEFSDFIHDKNGFVTIILDLK